MAHIPGPGEGAGVREAEQTRCSESVPGIVPEMSRNYDVRPFRTSHSEHEFHGKPDVAGDPCGFPNVRARELLFHPVIWPLIGPVSRT